jgi:GNAT superfamily N-acetyltransferase
MQTADIHLRVFGPDHLDAAMRLTRQCNWPHRPDDWRMLLELSKGVVALDAGNGLVGTVLMTPHGQDCATINTVMVDREMRGRGLGRKLAEAAMALAGDRRLRLIATPDGAPLYKKLGFFECGTIRQHQGEVQRVAAPACVTPAAVDDLPAIKALDYQAFGSDRSSLLDVLARCGKFVVIRRAGAVVGFAANRPFGLGEVVGPVVAPHEAHAKALISFFAASRAGAFLRVDTTSDTDLGGWLSEIGLKHVDSGTVMHTRPTRVPEEPSVRAFALASQAFG